MRIKEIRQARNIQQKVLASELGIRQNTLSQYETGVREPDLKMLCKIANSLDVSVGYLLGQEEKSGPITVSDDEASLDEELINRLCQLSEGELAKVDAFVQGLLAAR